MFFPGDAVRMAALYEYVDRSWPSPVQHSDHCADRMELEYGAQRVSAFRDIELNPNWTQTSV